MALNIQTDEEWAAVQHLLHDMRQPKTQVPLAAPAGSASPGAIAAKNEIQNAILRLETVAARCRHTMMGKEWTRRDHDADIIQLEVIPALRRAIWVMPNKADMPHLK